MARYLIVIPHENEHVACVRALDAISRFGSHFMTNANWGCANGNHAGYLIADVESRAVAEQMVPPQFRQDAQIVEVERFTRERIETLMAELEA